MKAMNQTAKRKVIRLIMAVTLSSIILMGCAEKEKINHMSEETAINRENNDGGGNDFNSKDGENQRTPTYNKENMDYKTFLSFSGIMEEKDYDGDGLTDFLKRKVVANTQEAVYYIKFANKGAPLFLGLFEQGYCLTVDGIDIDGDGLNELVAVGTNDHTYNTEDTATFEVYKQNKWPTEIYWDLMRIPKGRRLMEQGLDWQQPLTYQKKAGFDYILEKDADGYKIILDDPGQDSLEWDLGNLNIPDEVMNLTGKNVARPVFKFEIDHDNKSSMLLYQNIGTSQINIGTIITSIKWNADGNYTVEKNSFEIGITQDGLMRRY